MQANSVVVKKSIIGIVLTSILLFKMFSGCANPDDTITDPIKCITVDTVSRYEWYYVPSYTINDIYVADTSNIFIATEYFGIKYDGNEFNVINTGNYFFGTGVRGLNKNCVFWYGDTKENIGANVATVVKYENGILTTYMFPSDSNSAVGMLLPITPNKFWFATLRDKVIIYDNGVTKTYTFPYYYAGYYFYDYLGRQFLFVNEDNVNQTSGISETYEIIGDSLKHIGTDTLERETFGPVQSVGSDLVMKRKKEFYKFNGTNWVKFFNIDNFEPYFRGSYWYQSGKSVNEMLIWGPSTEPPLLFLNNMWSLEKIYGPFDYFSNPCKFYDDRIYLAVKGYVGYYLCKGRHKTKN